MPTVTTSSTTALNTTPYPPVFDGSKTIRPRPRKCQAPPLPVESETVKAPNNLEFAPPAPGSRTLKDLLAEAGEPDDSDTMHVTRFERLMRATNHNLLAVQPEISLADSRCKQFLSVDCRKKGQISRADFSKSHQANEVLCSLQGLFDFINKLTAGMESTLTVQMMRRKLRPRHQPC